MKTKGMIAGALVLSMIIGTNVFASDKSAVAKAQKELKSQLQDEFKTLPFDDISGLDENAEVYVSFIVTENGAVEIIKVESSNEDLKRHAEISLKDNDVVADELLKGEGYRVKMRFVLKS